MRYRILFFMLFSSSIIGIIGFIFWEQEYKFSLPTPKPEHLVNLQSGDTVDHSKLPFSTSKKTYVHFYNYDCPCSRFNIKEFQSLVKRFSKEVEFIAVINTTASSEQEVNQFITKYDLGIKTIRDDGKIAKALGVYSTPQAVILSGNKIYYKGNYNKARFCLSKNTKFAEQALTALVNNQKLPAFPLVATVAYGCELPSNQRKTQSIFTYFQDYGD